ncbi:WXG100 family type VII secretion target [Lentzea atacamensis]|uniref:WXG100 family type VII secretion target n=1 Tax=Lentzea atacamensis TaxID=531938 RepID=A0A316HXV6_9PSEU|nr:WXG100 family type VII secretion target [Lentzea atacamensis]PWK85546.1 WXG100 family type VII secretion target [Lentzea atacamensis]RAS66947.1 WXG100 family type VII secretion target [Lentzea atacamensis]
MSKTRLTPQQVIEIANKHSQEADRITSEQQQLRSNVATLTSINSGAMIQKLITVHQEWDTKTSEIVTTLGEMATTLNRAANTLQAQDEAGTF